MARLCVVLLIAASAIIAKADCRVDPIPTSWGFSNPPGRIEENRVRLSDVGQITTTFYLRLHQRLPLDAVAMVIEFTDAKGQEIASVPIAGTNDKIETSFHPPFPAELHQHWSISSTRPLLAGTFDGALDNSCPTQAKVTFATIRLADGTLQTFSASGWHIGPMPHVIPMLPSSYPAVQVTPPLTIIGRISIDRNGHVKRVDFEDAAKNPEALAWIKNQIEQLWDFHPALLDGRPRESVMNVLFRFPADATMEIAQSDRPSTMDQPLSVIQFFHSSEGSRKFLVTYGTLSEDQIE